MGKLSARNYSNYPPLNQFMFGLAALLGGSSLLATVVVMRLQLILADIGIYYFGRKLLKNMNRSPYLIFWYFLNPLVIIECTGNLHYEALMLFFFVLAFFLLSRKKPNEAKKSPRPQKERAQPFFKGQRQRPERRRQAP